MSTVIPLQMERRVLLALGLDAIVLALGSAVALLLHGVPESGAIEIAGLAAAVAAATAATTITGRWFNTFVIFLPVYALNFFVSGLYRTVVGYQPGQPVINDPGDLPRAVLLAVLGLIAATVGFLVAPARNREAQVERSWNPSDVRLLFALSELLGWGARLFMTVNGWQAGYLAQQYGSAAPAAANLLNFLAFLPSFALLLFAAGFTRRRRVLLGLMLFGELVWVMLTASKFALVPTIVALGFLLWRSRPHRPVRLLVATAAVVVGFVAFVVPITGAIRAASPAASRYGGVTGLFDRRQAILRVNREAAAQGQTGWAQLMQRESGLVAFTNVDTSVRQGAPRLGTLSLVAAADELVPSVLWPGKGAAVEHLAQATSALYGYGPDYRGGGLEVTLPGELLWGFGIPGLVLGMLAVGFLLRLLDARLIWRNPVHTAIGLLLASWVAAAAQLWMEETASQLIKEYLVVLALYWVVGKIRRDVTAQEGTVWATS